MSELWPHHHCALQAKDRCIFTAKGWKCFWQSSDFKWFLLHAGSSHLQSSTNRVGTDIEQREVLIPRDPGTQHQVPDILHPHQSPPHPGSWCRLAQPPCAHSKNQKSQPGTKLSPIAQGKWCCLFLLFHESHVLPASA